MTEKTLEKLPENVRNEIERLRNYYNGVDTNKSVARTASASYVKGLRDAGMITENERKTLFIYTTV